MPSSITIAQLRRALSRHRALLAGGLAAGAVASALSVLAPTAPAAIPVVVAARDVGAGTVLAAADLRIAQLPRAAVPDGALADDRRAVGRLLSGPLRRGEPLTDVRLAGPAVIGAGSGLVAAPVRIADAASASLLSVGDRIDVLAAATTGGAEDAAVVASDAEVLAAPAASADSADGALVLLATTPRVASRLAAAAVSSRLSLTLRPRR